MLSKLLWYEGLKRIDVSKAIAMSTGTFPALSLILAVVFLHEIPSAYQLSGLVIVVAGAYILLSKAQKVAPLEPV